MSKIETLNILAPLLILCILLLMVGAVAWYKKKIKFKQYNLINKYPVNLPTYNENLIIKTEEMLELESIIQDLKSAKDDGILTNNNLYMYSLRDLAWASIKLGKQKAISNCDSILLTYYQNQTNTLKDLFN